MAPVLRPLNNITMYALLAFTLVVLTVVAVVFGFFGLISYSGVSILISAVILIAACWLANECLGMLFAAPTNRESAVITGLILLFIFRPAEDFNGVIVLILAAVIAMASKYFLSFRGRHIFNPAAISAVILGLLGIGSAIWWVATPWLLPVVLLLGALIIIKIGEYRMVFAGLMSAVLVTLAVYTFEGFGFGESLSVLFLSFPLIFWATFMLTEPRAAPDRKRGKFIYAIIAGGLFGSQINIGPVSATPELALVVANLGAWIISTSGRSRLVLHKHTVAAGGMHEFSFTPQTKVRFLAGQYSELTLPHARSDARGVRRYFTIASAPSSNNIEFGLRIDESKPSSFKTALRLMKPGQSLIMSPPLGDFVMPSNTTIPIVWLAGGIGITPFRAMAEDMRASKKPRSIELLYYGETAESLMYQDTFMATAGFGLTTQYIVSQPDSTWSGLTGRISEEHISHLCQGSDRIFYISGPPMFVSAAMKLLRQLGIKKSRIITDAFMGY